MNNIIGWILIILSIPVLVLMVLQTIRKAKDLSNRIDEYHAEQDAKKNAPGPINPYEDLASLYSDPEDDKREGKQ